MKHPACPHCHRDQYVIKSGLNHTGSQRSQAAPALPSQITDTTPAETIELDELYTFVQQKKTRSTS